MPFFSIIIPTYNRANLIEKTLQSVLAQSETDFECIVVDDGGEDHTREVVENLGDERFRYHWKENGERGAARNFGTQLARGKWLNFVDSDDYLYPHHLEVARKNAELHAESCLFHLGYDIRMDGKVVREQSHYPPQVNDFIMKEWTLSCNGVFVPREIALEHPFEEDRRLAATEDSLLWLRMAARYPIYADNTITSSIIQHAERSMSTTVGEAFAEKTLLFPEVLERDAVFMEEKGRFLPHIKSNLMLLTALYLALGKSKRKAFRYLTRAIAIHPAWIFHRRFLGVCKHLIR